MNMLKIFEGCDCPQKTTYAVLFAAYMFYMIGLLYSFNTGRVNITSSEVFFNYVIKIVLAVLWFKVIEWACKQKLETVSWIIALLPLVAFTLLGSTSGKMANFL